MSYTKSVLQPDEQVVAIGRLHWIVYYRAIWYLIVCIILLLLAHNIGPMSRSSFSPRSDSAPWRS
jgi:hypothetical protein